MARHRDRGSPSQAGTGELARTEDESKGRHGTRHDFTEAGQ